MRRGAALCLILCLLWSVLVPVSAVSAGFADDSQIVNRPQVRLLVDLGMIAGYEDGSFQPRATLTRAQTAKLLALLCTETPAGTLNGRFSDVSGGWAADYIAYCADRGILSGYNGLFRPEDPVTGRELAKMLLVAVGQEPARYVGTGWAEAVDADAAELGIYNGYGRNPAETIDRDYACLLICNAMQAPALEGRSADGSPIYATDDLLNPLTYAEYRFGIIRYRGTLIANEAVDLSGRGQPTAPGTCRLAGHKDFAVSADLTLLGRPVCIYLWDGQVIGVPMADSTVSCGVFRDKAQLDAFLENSGFALAMDAAYYYNYTAANRQTFQKLTAGVEITVVDADGDSRFEQIFMTQWTEGLWLGDGRVRLDNGQTVFTAGFTARSDASVSTASGMQPKRKGAKDNGYGSGQHHRAQR